LFVEHLIWFKKACDVLDAAATTSLAIKGWLQVLAGGCTTLQLANSLE
jgi:hypothetical protein